MPWGRVDSRVLQFFPQAYDRTTRAGNPPDSRVLNYMSRLREEPDSEEGSSPDEGVPEKGSGHRGIGPPMMVGVGYTQRELCDGQTLASPGRWPPGSRIYPTSRPWLQIAECYSRFADHYGTEELLVSLASGKVTECPFPSEEVSIFNRELLDIATQNGFQMIEKSGDRVDVPINFRFLQLLLRIADDPENGLGGLLTRSESGTRKQDAQVASRLSPEEEVAPGITVRPSGLFGRIY